MIITYWLQHNALLLYLHRFHLPPEHLLHLLGKLFRELLSHHLLYLHRCLDILVFL